jgi:O-acetyl-ADP-ribose deacetylase (regulator of RNase III)
MKYVLCYSEEPLGEAWRQNFSSQAGVEISAGDICRVECDAIVSPANSFGFMDGGLDYQLSERFGWDLEKRVQKAIQARPMRELLIGEATIIPTLDPKVPWLVVAPTMRIRATINAYLAMKAILLAVREHHHEQAIETVAIPGLGTGIGELAPEVCASQMWQAFQEIVLENHPYPRNFVEAQKTHLALNRTSMLYGTG